VDQRRVPSTSWPHGVVCSSVASNSVVPNSCRSAMSARRWRSAANAHDRWTWRRAYAHDAVLLGCVEITSQSSARPRPNSAGRRSSNSRVDGSSDNRAQVEVLILADGNGLLGCSGWQRHAEQSVTAPPRRTDQSPPSCSTPVIRHGAHRASSPRRSSSTSRSTSATSTFGDAIDASAFDRPLDRRRLEVV